MSLSDDIQQFPGIKFGVTIYINSSGNVTNDSQHSQVLDVLKVIDGSYEDVLQLIGYPRIQIEYMFVDEILRSTDDVKTRLKNLPQRQPNSYLLEDNGILYGVVIDESSQTKVVGVVTLVIPGIFDKIPFKSIAIDNHHNWVFTRLRDCDVKERVLSAAFFGVVRKDGFLFLEIVRPVGMDDISELALLLNKGYYVIDEMRIDWIRKESQEDNEITRSTFEYKQCLVHKRGGCVRTTDRFEIYGPENDIINYEELKLRMLGKNKSDGSDESDENGSQNGSLFEFENDETVQHSFPRYIDNKKPNKD